MTGNRKLVLLALLVPTSLLLIRFLSIARHLNRIYIRKKAKLSTISTKVNFQKDSRFI